MIKGKRLITNDEHIELCTVEEVASFLRISPKTVRNKLSDGSFPLEPVYVMGKSGQRFIENELVEHMKSVIAKR